MKTATTIEQVREVVNANNYSYRGNEFNSYFDLKTAAEEHFEKIGEAKINKVKVDKYFVDEVNTTVSVEYYESHVDSGVNDEDYFHAFVIKY